MFQKESLGYISRSCWTKYYIIIYYYCYTVYYIIFYYIDLHRSTITVYSCIVHRSQLVGLAWMDASTSTSSALSHGTWRKRLEKWTASVKSGDKIWRKKGFQMVAIKTYQDRLCEKMTNAKPGIRGESALRKNYIQSQLLIGWSKWRMMYPTI